MDLAPLIVFCPFSTKIEVKTFQFRKRNRNESPQRLYWMHCGWQQHKQLCPPPWTPWSSPERTAQVDTNSCVTGLGGVLSSYRARTALSLVGTSHRVDLEVSGWAGIQGQGRCATATAVTSGGGGHWERRKGLGAVPKYYWVWGRGMQVLSVLIRCLASDVKANQGCRETSVRSVCSNPCNLKHVRGLKELERKTK